MPQIKRTIVLETAGELKRQLRQQNCSKSAKLILLLYKLKKSTLYESDAQIEELNLDRGMAEEWLHAYREQGLTAAITSVERRSLPLCQERQFSRYRHVLNMHLDQINCYKDACNLIQEYFAIELSFNEIYRMFIDYYGLPLSEIRKALKEDRNKLIKAI